MAYRGRGWDTWEALSTELEDWCPYSSPHTLFALLSDLFFWLMITHIDIDKSPAHRHSSHRCCVLACRGFDLLDGLDTCMLDLFQKIEDGRACGSRG